MQGPKQRWLIYSLGGGFGHLQRSLSLARAAARLSVHTTILTNSPWARRILDAGPEPNLPLQSPLLPEALRLHVVPPSTTAIESKRVVASLLDDEPEPWDAWIVDTFPRGLGGELTDLLSRFDGHLAWVHRDLAPGYVEHLQRDAPWELYSTILSPGEAGPLAHLAVPTAPWLLLSSEECLSPEDARTYWGAGPDDFLIVVAASGTPDEAAAMEQLARNMAAHPQVESTVIRIASMTESRLLEHPSCERRSPWPLLGALHGVDLLVGAGGYNTLHETYAANVPTVCLTQKRQYDRQGLRIARAPHAIATEGGSAGAIWSAVRQARQLELPSSPGREQNGALDAAALIFDQIC